MPTHLLMLIALAASLPAIAATTAWEAYDIKNCKRWSMTPDDFQGSGPRFAKAEALAKRANAEEIKGGWLVVEGGILWEGGEPLYGVCRFESDYTILSCLPGIDFPLSGVTYKLARQKGANDTYVCSHGCERTEAKMILEQAYEGETVLSTRAARLVSQFHSRCNDEAKRTKFFQLLNQGKQGVK